MEVEWKQGLPETDGFYWLKSFGHILVVVRHMSHMTIYGHHGSMPTPVHATVIKHLKHAVIPAHQEQPWEWSTRFGSGNLRYAWVKDKRGKIGFGLLRPNYHGPTGSIIWLHGGSYHGAWMREIDGYTFQSLELPDKLMAEET